eukprot:5572221-Amphidinium_carterae.1
MQLEFLVLYYTRCSRCTLYKVRQGEWNQTAIFHVCEVSDVLHPSHVPHHGVLARLPLLGVCFGPIQVIFTSSLATLASGLLQPSGIRSD